MIRHCICAIAVSVLALLCISASAYQHGAKRLFDGKSFKGWEGNLSVFRIDDGAIVGGTLKAPIERNELL